MVQVCLFTCSIERTYTSIGASNHVFIYYTRIENVFKKCKIFRSVINTEMYTNLLQIYTLDSTHLYDIFSPDITATIWYSFAFLKKLNLYKEI